MVRRLQLLSIKLKTILDPTVGSLNTEVLDLGQVTTLLQKADKNLGHSRVIAYGPSEQYNPGETPLVRSYHEA